MLLLIVMLPLMLGVGLLTAVVGTGAAWLVVMYRFPGARWQASRNVPSCGGSG